MLCFTSPNEILPCMISGGEKAISLIITLIPTYAIWLGFFNLIEACGLANKLSKILSKPIKKIFGKTDEKTTQLISLNVSANLLGMSAIATPLGISACSNLDKKKNLKAITYLFILSCSGLCIIPTNVVSLRTKHLSNSASTIILPILLTNFFFICIGFLLAKILIRNENI